MLKLNAYLPDVTAMEQVGADLAAHCVVGGKIIFLQGNLGAGKTTLVRGFLRALGYEGKVKSPTYTLVESYELDNITIHHFDLYRIHEPEELEAMGLRDYLQPHTICLIEWPEKNRSYLPSPHFSCYIDILESGRNITIEGK